MTANSIDNSEMILPSPIQSYFYWCIQYNSFYFNTKKKFCFHSSGSAPRSFLTSIKIIVLWTSLLAYVLIQSYGATLVSHITAVTSWEAPFNNLEGLLQSQYSLAVVNGSNIHSELKVRKLYGKSLCWILGLCSWKFCNGRTIFNHAIFPDMMESGIVT